MMPNRLLRTRALTSRKLGAVSGDAEALYYRLMLAADDHGRFHSDPPLVQAACYPRRERAVGPLLDDLFKVGLLHRYEHEGEPYLVFDVWDQTVRSESKFPQPPTFARSREQVRADVGLDVDVVLDGDVRESADKPRKRNELVDTLAEIEGSDPLQLTRSHARSLGVAVAEIKTATPDVSPEEIRRRASVYRRKHPDWELTGPSLAKHWAGCGGPSRDVASASERAL